MQQLNSEIAALLRTFDGSMGKRGFKNCRGGAVTKDCSYLVGSSEYWAPPYMYRMLRNKKDNDDIIILNVVLDDPDEPESIQEPFVACARFRFQRDRAEYCADEWDASELWYCTTKEFGRIYSKKDLPIGSACLSEWHDGEIDAMEDARLFAVPLADVVDSEALDKLVIQPIL